MNESIRKRIVFAVFAVTLVWGYFNLFRKPVTTPSDSGQYETAEVLPTNHASRQIDSSLVGTVKEAGWKNNPFKKDAAQSIDVSSPRMGSITPQWNVSGIVYSPTNPLAIINGRMVRVGDKIENAIVSKIEKKKVTLDYGGSSITLTVNKG